MSEPLVCAVMLTRDRHDFARRAVNSFISQTYRNKLLVIWDSGMNPLDIAFVEDHLAPVWSRTGETAGRIGAQRNAAAKWICGGPTPIPDILIHWDDDDFSHPNRIAEQVALLQSGDLDAVGYNEMLFWRANEAPHPIGSEPETWDGGQAWLYRNNDPRYCIGTSLCYWRKTWEAKPFNPKLPERRGGTGEDTEWIRGLRTKGIGSIPPEYGAIVKIQDYDFNDQSPRMIATIHGSNTQDYLGIETAHNWTRFPEWDAHCRERMEL